MLNAKLSVCSAVADELWTNKAMEPFRAKPGVTGAADIATVTLSDQHLLIYFQTIKQHSNQDSDANTIKKYMHIYLLLM